MRFVARPFVCGVLGRPDPERLARLRRVMPDLVTVHERPDVVLLASRELTPYRTDGGALAWAFGDRQPAEGVDWRTAAITADAAGLSDDGERAVLHAGAHGYLDIFHRRLGDATWFASTIDALLDLDPAPLDIDWDTWACTIVLTIPLAERTPFVGVARLLGATTLVLDHTTGAVADGRWDPPWSGLPAPRPGAGDPRMILEVMHSAVARHGDAPTVLPLSGGYDSRLLSILLRDARIPTTTMTTSKDDGRDDVGIAREVAAALGQAHTVVDPTGLTYAEAADESLTRMEYRAAQHLWSGAMARRIRADGVRVADAIALDTLFHNEHMPGKAILAPSGPEREAALFAALWRGGLRGKVLGAEAAGWLVETARRRWQARWAGFQDDPNGLILAVLSTRTTMGVGIMGQWLYGPEVSVVMPAIDADVVAASFTVDQLRKVDGTFYRELLAAADPEVAAIRSTRDPAQRGAVGERVKGGPAARAWLLEHTRSATTVPGLVHPRLIELLETGRVKGVTNPDGSPITPEHELKRRSTIAQSALGVGTLGAWLDRYGDRIGRLDPPWPVAPTATGAWSFASRLRRRSGSLVGRIRP